MTLLKKETVTFNGIEYGYEGNFSAKDGSATRESIPQVGRKRLIKEDISTEFSEIKISVRDPEVKKVLMDSYDNGTNNVISYRDKTYINVNLVERPEDVDTEAVEFVFNADMLR